MRKNIKRAAMALAVLTLAGTVAAADASEVTGPPASTKPVYLYKTTFVRAAQGKLLDLIALYKDRMAVIEAAGEARPFWWRHTQGDQWDLMILTPMGSYAEYYAKAAGGASGTRPRAGPGLSWRRFRPQARRMLVVEGRRLSSWGRRSNS